MIKENGAINLRMGSMGKGDRKGLGRGGGSKRGQWSDLS